ncbi:MAG: PAS domain-containing protein [Candidatus Omnitrophica bacterium]|nr:PAS domain-containing protein [Candidatus Omnitrophota bacterium]
MEKTRTLEADLLMQACDASSSAITVADASAPDMPLIYVNKTFEQITGYEAKEVLGVNCRFLQGKDREQPGVQEIAKALQSGKSCTVQLRNYRKDGTPFWNELSLAPVFGSKGDLTHYIGVQTDITKRVEAETELNRHRNHLERLVEERTRKLEEKNLALQEILSQIELEKKKIKDQVIENVDSVLMPLIHKLRSKLDAQDKKYTDVLQKNLEELTSTFGASITRKLYSLTPREIHICNMIRSGLSSKDMAQFFNVSLSTIENQRNTIRKKLGISKKKANLSSYLQSLSADTPLRSLHNT